MTIKVELQDKEYDIVLCRGVLQRAGELLNLARKVLIVTDSGVPKQYAEGVAAFCKQSVIVTVPEGESSKCFDVYISLCKTMLENKFSRKDAVVAVGGGVVGDLAGFAASTYMRGIDFYNIPTTVLSQVDSSIGGKVAIDFDGIKNVIGAFYQPKKVLIDPDVLSTLPKRQIANGLAEAVKMALTSCPELFYIFEHKDPNEYIEKIIECSLLIKKTVVEQDEKECGLRKVLNFGHTIGHAIESAAAGKLYHGECVALGMLPMCSEDIKQRLVDVMQKIGLPIGYSYDKTAAADALLHDKKAQNDHVDAIFVNDIGKFEICSTKVSDLIAKL